MGIVDRGIRLLPLLAVAALAVPSVALAQEGAKEPVEATPDMVAVQDLALTRQLVLYGQRTGSPEPMIAAGVLGFHQHQRAVAMARTPR